MYCPRRRRLWLGESFSHHRGDRLEGGNALPAAWRRANAHSPTMTKSQRPRSASQAQSVSKRFWSGKSGSPLT